MGTAGFIFLSVEFSILYFGVIHFFYLYTPEGKAKREKAKKELKLHFGHPPNSDGFSGWKKNLKENYEVQKKYSDNSKKNMCLVKYLGGHKKYGQKSVVSLDLTCDSLLLKELPGEPETRIDIPYPDIIDFGLATKEQITVTRMLLVGILAFALKKNQEYLYVKYKDQMGFEHNPLLGEFKGAHISEISSQLYSLIEEAKKGQQLKQGQDLLDDHQADGRQEG